MRPGIQELHKAEQEIDQKLKTKAGKCIHGKNPQECKLCKKSELYDYFKKGIEEQKNMR